MENKKVDFGEIKNIIDGFVAQETGLLAGIDFVIGVSRGGLVPAALLAARIDKPLVAAYINRQDEIFFDRPDWIKGKSVLVVDDIVRSGRTLWLLKKYLAKNCSPKTASFFTLFKVKLLINEVYNIPSFSREIDEDVVFPWDYDRE